MTSKERVDRAKAEVRAYLQPLLTEVQMGEVSTRIALFVTLAVKREREVMIAARKAADSGQVDPVANMMDVLFNGRPAR